MQLGAEPEGDGKAQPRLAEFGVANSDLGSNFFFRCRERPVRFEASSAAIAGEDGLKGENMEMNRE